MRQGPVIALTLALLLAAGLGQVAAEGVDRAAPGPESFGLPMRDINSAILAKFKYGLGLFRHERQPMQPGATATGGPGPLYNATSCIGCHVGDGRGSVDMGRSIRSLVLLLNGPDGPDPVYGAQLQDRAVEGMAAEGRPVLTWRDTSRRLADGTVVPMRVPEVAIADLGYGPLGTETQVEARLTPQLVGLGWLAALDEATIRALADPEDADGDGISGMVRDLDDGRIGRFGWKADSATLEEQAEAAAARDMGLAVPVASAECRAAQACPAKAALDLRPNDITLIAFYVAHLGVPERRDSTAPEVMAGETIFAGLGCGGCHVPRLRTSTTAPAEFAGREIAPYTDLLLHDMGPELAAGSGALAREWRTPPLWGIGLTETVSGEINLLHDGRARSVTEAILWHGGEAQAAREGFASLGAADRAALLAFLADL